MQEITKTQLDKIISEFEYTLIERTAFSPLFDKDSISIESDDSQYGSNTNMQLRFINNKGIIVEIQGTTLIDRLAHIDMKPEKVNYTVLTNDFYHKKLYYVQYYYNGTIEEYLDLFGSYYEFRINSMLVLFASKKLWKSFDSKKQDCKHRESLKGTICVENFHIGIKLIEVEIFPYDGEWYDDSAGYRDSWFNDRIIKCHILDNNEHDCFRDDYIYAVHKNNKNQFNFSCNKLELLK